MLFIDLLFNSQHLVFDFEVVLHAHSPRGWLGPWSLHASDTTPTSFSSLFTVPAESHPSASLFSWLIK